MKRWNCFNIATDDESEAAFYPLLGSPGSRFPVALEAADGTDLIQFGATDVKVLEKVDGRYEAVAEPPEHCTWEAIITDSRLILYSRNLHKGGGYRAFDPAGLIVAGAANAVSRGLASRRNKAELLVAHVRYPWLGTVSGRTKVDRRTYDAIQIYLDCEPTADGHRVVVLAVKLAKGSDGLTVAQHLARRAARYRLVHYGASASDGVRTRLTELASTPRLEGEPGTGWSTYVIPNLFRVNELTAFPPGHDRTPVRT